MPWNCACLVLWSTVLLSRNLRILHLAVLGSRNFTRARRISQLSFAVDDVNWWDTDSSMMSRETAAPADNVHGIVNNEVIMGDQE